MFLYLDRTKDDSIFFSCRNTSFLISNVFELSCNGYFILCFSIPVGAPKTSEDVKRSHFKKIKKISNNLCRFTASTYTLVLFISLGTFTKTRCPKSKMARSQKRQPPPATLPKTTHCKLRESTSTRRTTMLPEARVKCACQRVNDGFLAPRLPRRDPVNPT